MPDPYRELPEESIVTENFSENKSEQPVSAENEILELEKQLAAKKAILKEKEKPLEQILNQEQSGAVSGVAAIGSAVSSVQEIKKDTEKFKGAQKNQQLKGLVDLAFLKGVFYATEVVKNLDNPYLLDEFHDALVDELHKELVDKGKLEEI